MRSIVKQIIKLRESLGTVLVGQQIEVSLTLLKLISLQMLKFDVRQLSSYCFSIFLQFLFHKLFWFYFFLCKVNQIHIYEHWPLLRCLLQRDQSFVSIMYQEKVWGWTNFRVTQYILRIVLNHQAATNNALKIAENYPSQL